VSLLSGKKKATMFSLFHFGGNLGFGVGPILATLFFVHFGMKGSLLFIIPGVILTSSSFSSPTESRAAARPPEGLVWAKGASSRQSSTPMILLLLVVILRSATRLGLMTFVPFYFINILNRDPWWPESTFPLSCSPERSESSPADLSPTGTLQRIVLITLASARFPIPVLSHPRDPVPGFFHACRFDPHLIQFHHYGHGSKLHAPEPGDGFRADHGLAMGIGGIATTALGWVADTWGIPFTLQIIFVLPVGAFLACWPIPYPPEARELSPQPSPNLRKSEGTDSLAQASGAPVDVEYPI